MTAELGTESDYGHDHFSCATNLQAFHITNSNQYWVNYIFKTLPEISEALKHKPTKPDLDSSPEGSKTGNKYRYDFSSSSGSYVEHKMKEKNLDEESPKTEMHKGLE